MGVRGLSTYVSEDPKSFVKHELHNTYLVFDAENFINHCYRGSGLARHYGGEYMDFVVCVYIFLKQLRQCRITPIFVFDGCHGQQGLKLDTLLKRNRERIVALRNFIEQSKRCPDADNLTSAPDIQPKLTNAVFVDVLRQTETLYISCEREADVHVAELASFLHCPLVTNDSDFYIFRPPASYPYQVIPLASLGQPHRINGPGCGQCDSLRGCHVLPCVMFNPSDSPLARIQPPFLPLLAALVGNDFVTAVRVPPVVDQLFRDPARSARFRTYNHKRIDALLEWLASFGKDTEAPLSAIISLYTETERVPIASQIREVVLDYTVRPWATGRKLALLLGLTGNAVSAEESSEKTEKSVTATDSPTPCSQTQLEAGESSTRQLVESIFRALPGTNSNSSNCELSSTRTTEESLSRGWSPALVEKLHFLDLPTGVMDTLYVLTGSVQRILFEDLTGQAKSIYWVLDPLRELFYNLFLGVEIRSNTVDKLCGLHNGRVIEHRRRADQMQPFPIPLNALSVPHVKTTHRPPCVESVHYLWTQLKLTPLIRSTNLPMESQLIPAVLVLWFRHTAYAAHIAREPCEFSPVPLAFVTCALATQAHLALIPPQARSTSLGHSVAQLCESFASLATRFKNYAYNCQFDITLVHQINELQLVTLEVKNLQNLIEGIMTEEENTCSATASHRSPSASSSNLKPTFDRRDPFGWPNWILFPSGRMIYWLSKCLQATQPTARFHEAVHTWLPRVHTACSVMGKSCDLNQLKQQMSTIFQAVGQSLRG